MNSHIIKYSEIAKDTVLLFECAADKNPVGGQELMTFDNHKVFSQKATVILVDGTVRSIKPEEVVSLKWKP